MKFRPPALFAAIALASSPNALDWESCVREAARKNADLLAARQSWNAADEKVGSTRSPFLPQISAETSYSQAKSSTATASEPSAGISLSATQNVFSGFSDFGKTRQSEAGARSSRASLQAKAASVSHDLKSSYSGLQHAQDLRRLTRDIVRRREENLRLVELRYEGGRENKGSLLQTKAVLSRARLEQLQAEHGVLTARRALAQLLGRDDWELLEVAGPIPLGSPPANPDLKELASRSPDHLKAVAEEEAASAGLTVARSGFFPTLSLTASLGRKDSNFLPGPGTDHWSLGASVSVPLFSGFKDLHSTRSASATLSAARYALDSTDRQLLTQLQQAHATWTEAVEEQKVQQQFLEAAVARAEIARNKYDNGLLSFEDWDLIETDLISSQKGALKSVRDRVLAEAAWERLLGKGAITE